MTSRVCVYLCNHTSVKPVFHIRFPRFPCIDFQQQRWKSNLWFVRTMISQETIVGRFSDDTAYVSENSIFALFFSLRTSFAVVCLSYMIIGRRETLKKIRSHTLSIVTTVFHIFIDDFLPHLDASASASVYKAICFRFISPLISLLFATYLGWDVFLFLFRSTTKIPDLLLTRLRFDGDKHRRATPIWIFFLLFHC